MRFESNEVILGVYRVVSNSKVSSLFSMFSMIIIESTITCDIGLSSSPGKEGGVKERGQSVSLSFLLQYHSYSRLFIVTLIHRSSKGRMWWWSIKMGRFVRFD